MSDELIQRLVLELQPVAPLRSAVRRSIRFGVLALAATALAASLAGLRADLMSKLSEPEYLRETFVLLVLFAGATFAALRSAVPGASLRHAAWLVAAATGAWLWLLGRSLGAEAHGLELASGVACLRRTLLLSAFPAVVMLAMLRRSAPLEAGRSGFLALLAACSAAVLGTRLLCPKDDAPHALLWHVAPLALLSLLGWLVGRSRLGEHARKNSDRPV